MSQPQPAKIDHDIASDIIGLLGLDLTPDRISEIEKTIARRRIAASTGSEDPCRTALGRVMNRHASQVMFHDRALADLCWDALASTPVMETTVRRCAKIAHDACLVEPDGGSPTEDEAAVCDAASSRILALLGQRVHPIPDVLRSAA